MSSVTGLEAGGEGGFIATAHNSQKAQEFFPSTFESGGSDAVRSGESSTLCGNYKHPDPAEQKSGHAEARLLDGMERNAPPTKLTFNIDWRPNTGAPSKMPCETCLKMMCAARACGHEIWLCKDDGPPVQVSAKHCQPEKEKGKNSKKYYRQLKADMGEA